MATRILRIGRRIEAITSRFVDALERLARLSGAKTPEWTLGRRLQQFEIDTQRLRYGSRTPFKDQVCNHERTAREHGQLVSPDNPAGERANISLVVGSRHGSVDNDRHGGG
jgi:hypothetical protein